ncbi:MAG: DUF2723 domain-containing protein [Armatimonadetes bacterium]|nr:DUF2723 domain-containing protein [Armatimonadota bacterium]
MVRGLSAIRTRTRDRAESIPAVWVTVALFAVAFPILAYNCAPAVSFHDSGEFSLAVYSAGLPHSPGAPTWMILNLIFRLFTFGAEAARSANLFSAFCGAITVAFAGAFVFRHFSDRANPIRWLTAIIAALSVMGTGAFLEQSFIAEQYTLMTAVMAAILLVIQTNEGNPKAKWYWLMGLLWGLAVGNHPSQVILGFLFLLPVIQKRKEVKIWKSVLCGIGGVLTGLLVFIYLPIRSHANPVMNWGHPNTWQNFVFSVTRQQWDTRPFTAAPTGFIKEWFRSYNLFGEMGAISTVLAVFGFVLGFRRARRPLSWILMLIVPYGILMLLGHLHQKGMDLMYIRFYGVRDWHIPIYMGLSMLGAMGAVWLLDMRHKVTDKIRVGGLSVAALGLAGTFPFHLSQETMRNYIAPVDYAKDYVAGLPDNAILSTFTDDASHIVGYEHFANHLAPGMYFTFGMPQNGLTAQNSSKWTLEMKKTFMTKCITTPSQNPISLPYVVSDDEIRHRPLFTEFTAGTCPWLADYCLPHGYLVQLLERPTTNDEVLKADDEFMAQHPEMFSKPNGHQHRLTREAMSYAHTRRGLFFMKRKMWQRAKDCFELAMAWEPNNPQIIFPYGATLEEIGDYVGAEKAYLTCIDIMPDFVSPRQNLALLYAFDGQNDLANKYLDEELTLSKHDTEVVKAAQEIRAKMAANKKR